MRSQGRGNVPADRDSHLPCGDETHGGIHPFLLQQGVELRWVSCWCDKQLGHPKGWEFSIPWVEFDAFKGAGPGEIHLLPCQRRCTHESLSLPSILALVWAQHPRPREVMLSWHPHPPGRDSCCAHSSCAIPAPCCPPAVPRGPPEHLQHTEERWEQFGELPHPSPFDAAFPGERAAAPHSSSGKLLAAPAELGSEPGTPLAWGQLCRAGQRPQRWLCSCCLLAASPQPRCHTSDTENLQQRFQGAASPEQDRAHPSPAFPQDSSKPGAIQAGPGVCINPSWSRFPSPFLPVCPELSSHQRLAHLLFQSHRIFQPRSLEKDKVDKLRV